MMLGRWDRFHEERGVGPFGSTETYRIGAQWLHGLAVEDWGAGTGWFTRFHDNVTTVDGSGTPDVLADLCQYRSEVEGVFMRHVLDHNEDWQQILDNLCESFTRRAFIAVFTPDQDVTGPIAWNDEFNPPVPDIGFNPADINDRLDCEWRSWRIDSDTVYGSERIWTLWR